MLYLSGGHVCCPLSGRNAVTSVLVDGGKIVSVGEPAPQQATVVDCQGLVIAPGFVDLSCEMGDPGETWREGLAHGSRVAAAGGYTTVLISPNTVPTLDEPSRVADVVSRAGQAPAARIGVTGALTVDLSGAHLAEMGMLVEAGCMALGDGARPIADLLVLRRSLEYSARFGVPTFLRPGVPALEERGVIHEGLVAARVGLRGISPASEEIGVGQIVSLMVNTTGAVHLTHVTTARAARLVENAQQEGLCLTAAVPARHLLVTDALVETTAYDTAARLMPPLRPQHDQAALQQAVRAGVVMIGADHVPWTRVEKEMEFSDANPGAVGLESAFQAAYTALGDIGVVVSAMSVRPAAVLGRRAEVVPGAPADLVLLDLHAQGVLPRHRLSHGVNEPLVGLDVKGAVRATLVGGRPVHGMTAEGGLS